jgi:hypothetical protein
LTVLLLSFVAIVSWTLIFAVENGTLRVAMGGLYNILNTVRIRLSHLVVERNLLLL